MPYRFTVLLIFTPLFVFAHGGGQVVQSESWPYRIVLDAVSKQIYSGRAERINFELELIDGAVNVPFSHVWVRITGTDNDFLFAGNIQAAPKGFVTGISYLFPNEGVYNIAVRFFDGEDMIVESELPVSVSGSEQFARVKFNNPWNLAALFVFALLFGGFLFGRFKEKNRK